jgi:hypothetical protein
MAGRTSSWPVGWNWIADDPQVEQQVFEDRCDEVSNEPRPGPPRVLGDAQIDTLINATLKTTPRCHALVTRSNAMHPGLSQSDGKTA